MSTETGPRLLGAVLAGGESRRFGSDKAAHLLGGKSLAERAAETLGRVVDDVVIVSSRAPTTTRWPHLPDSRPGQGPLAGLEAALLRAREMGLEGAFVLACDLPLVDEAVVRAVLGALGDRRAAGPARAGSPAMEPLCAAYRVECLPLVAEALDRGERAAHRLFDAAEGVTTPLPPEKFLNVNDSTDRARAASVLEGQAG